ncbi:MAG TPA: hypothetical protein PKY63_09115 [Bacteroidales bacterium]|nr:hypothetical protein [Bacteroidales bacterium]
MFEILNFTGKYNNNQKIIHHSQRCWIFKLSYKQIDGQLDYNRINIEILNSSSREKVSLTWAELIKAAMEEFKIENNIGPDLKGRKSQEEE